MPMETKNIVLRLEPSLAERLRLIAEAESRTVSDVAREAIARHVEERRANPEFKRLLRENLRRHQKLMKMLAED